MANVITNNEERTNRLICLRKLPVLQTVTIAGTV
jgi:hypothetical protein